MSWIIITKLVFTVIFGFLLGISFQQYETTYTNDGSEPYKVLCLLCATNIIAIWLP
jgi:hypothetical protein